MGSAVSSAALNAGTFSACFAIFGSIIGFFQPTSLFKESDLSPFFEWYFPPSVGITSTISSRARIVASLELSAGLYLLSKVLWKRPVVERKKPLALLGVFFIYSTIGHTIVEDDLIIVAATMLFCSGAALLSLIVANGLEKSESDRKGE